MIDFKQSKQQVRDDLKQSILQQARVLIQKRGFQDLSMRKLASGLKCSPGTLYLYFKNKQEILDQLVSSAFDELSLQLKSIELKPEQPIDYLRQLMHAYIDFGLEHHDHYQFAFMTSRTSNDGPYRPNEAFQILTDAVNTCVKSEMFTSNDVQLLSQTIWAGIHGITSLLIVLPSFPWLAQEKLIQHHINSLVDGNLKIRSMR